MADLIDTNEDARLQAVASQFFYLAGDIFAGSDIERRYDPGMVGAPLLGPRTNGIDYQIGANGEVIKRGTTTTAGTQGGTKAASIQITPGMLLLAGLVYLLLRKG